MGLEPKYIVVIGASAGGINPVIELSAQLKAEMDMAVFVVLHLTPGSTVDILIERIQKNSEFICGIAQNNNEIESRHLYLASSDEHLLVKKGKMVLGNGPPENRWRPSIDVLFRSAAASYDARVIGIILSGLLADGTSGMIAIKRCGGTCIVQDPKQAEYPDMPQSVLDNVKVDYCLPVKQMGAVLLEKTLSDVYRSHEVPHDVIAEAGIAEKAAIGITKVEELGKRSEFSCPDCGGGLWKMVQENIARYRCYTGHVYSTQELSLKQSKSLENTLWVALRMMEERKTLLKKMSGDEKGKGCLRNANLRKEREEDLQNHIERLKELLFNSKKN